MLLIYLDNNPSTPFTIQTMPAVSCPQKFQTGRSALLRGE
jgi:hypothetical protein